jgi:Zn-dependent peptidase ImmA (M78 family)
VGCVGRNGFVQSKKNHRDMIRKWGSLVILAANFAMFGAMVVFFVCRPVALTAPWDGPALATVALTVAAIVVAAVGIGVALLAAWGYTTLREHAGNIASEAANVAADKAADRKVEQLMKDWGLLGSESGGEEVAQAYSKEWSMSDGKQASQPNATNPMSIAASFFHTAPVDLEKMAGALGLSVNMNAKLPADVSGSIIRSDRSYRIDVNSTHSFNRKRFTLAHEIAHYLLHRDLIGDGIQDNALYRSRLSDFIEIQANKLAAQMLMPAPLVRDVYRVVKSLVGLTAAFQVSEEAMRIRLKELGLAP